MRALIAISLFLITSAYADDELLILSDKIAEQETELACLKELSRVMIVNKSLDIEEIKQQKESLEWGNIGYITKGEKNEESNSAEDNQKDSENKK